jgi:hypothetical protein
MNVTRTVVLSGNPRTGSRTLKLATAVGAAISAEPPLVIDMADLGPADIDGLAGRYAAVTR